MRLAVLGGFCQTRLSFMRVLLRRLKKEQWRFSRPQWQIDAAGIGYAVYEARTPSRVYSLLVFSHKPPPLRSDRVIAEAWDATFTLFDGVPTADDLQQMAAQVSKQEAGRQRAQQFVLSRANRSTRLFAYVVDCLANGTQPAMAHLAEVGYLMRTTAVYGNGKFGLADRSRVAARPEFTTPFQAELLAVWLFRAFPIDLAEHLAATKNPQAVKLSPPQRRLLGIGNSTGLGMAPFLIAHPALLHCWIAARETALARVRALPAADKKAAFMEFLARAQLGVTMWQTADEQQQRRIKQLSADLQKVAQQADTLLRQKYPWEALHQWSDAHLHTEGREMLVSLIIEPHGDLTDDLAEQMAFDEDSLFVLDGRPTVAEYLAILRRRYAWIWREDFSQSAANARFWYVSEEKLEPRLGERYEEAGADVELPLSVMRDMQFFWRDLEGAAADETLGGFLARQPQYRHLARRAQTAERFPYGEIQDNLISAKMLPLDLLRCKLSFFGATKFDPRSDRWLRITMYQDAPYADELADCAADDWAWPPLSASFLQNAGHG